LLRTAAVSEYPCRGRDQRTKQRPLVLGQIGRIRACALGVVGRVPEPVRYAVADGRSVVAFMVDDRVQLHHQGFRYSFRLRHPSSSSESPVLCLIRSHTPHDRWSPRLTYRHSLTARSVEQRRLRPYGWRVRTRLRLPLTPRPGLKDQL